ncbi:Na(+)/H(+) antiporter subunit D [Haloarcula marina]|uniref:Na(+)/H(+) antiporter subunit D n=1 Tax=Haloarcula marina TaxID=2961574 RepID=UPI0020B65A34|nr:Na(+)/H(+) antiporter subunit D [Halomicroarcula marina]
MTAPPLGPVASPLLTTVPPAVVLITVGVLVAVLPRRAGHAVAAFTGLGTALWLSAVPSGAHLPAQFLGFDAVLFHVDSLSRLLGIAYGFITAVTAVYAYGSGRESHQTALGLVYAGTALGIVFAGDWLSLLAFWEVMSVISALTLWSSGGAAVRAGFRYMVFHAIGGIFLVGAVALQHVEVGSFLFSASAGIAPGIPAALAAVGIGVNAGFVALHTWIPDAYPKPHFVTSVVLCGYTTKTAVYALYRAFPDGHLLLAYAGVSMTLFGVTYALVQTNMRRLLSYHIQSQVGYMVAGIGIGSVLGVAGGFAHLVNNVLYKSLLFMVAGVIIYRTGKEDLKKIGGLYRVMPLTFVAFLAAAFAIAGVPGFSGFVSKDMVKEAAKKEHLTTLKWLLTIAGIGTTMSFVKFGYYAFLHGEPASDIEDATRGQSVAMIAIAAFCVLFGVYPSLLLDLLPGTSYIGDSFQPYTVAHVLEVLGYTAIGIVGFFAIRKPLSQVRNLPDIDAVYNPLAFYSLRAVVDGFERFAGVCRNGVDGITTRVGALATAPDPLSHASSERFGLPTMDLTSSVLLLGLLAALLLGVLLV